MAGSHLLTTASPYHRPLQHQNRQSSSQHLLSAQALLKANSALFAFAAALIEALPQYIPGYKTSATFLSSLRTNLCIAEDDGDYVATTVWPSTQAARDYFTGDLAEVPAVRTLFAESEADKQEAMRLIVESVAHQQEVALQSFLTYPLNIAGFIICMAGVWQCLQRSSQDKMFFPTMLCSIMAYFALAQWIVNGYAMTAKKSINSDWLGDDLVLLTKYGDKMIGAVVLRWDTSSTSRGRGRSKRAFKGTIRAWAVAEKYRGIGEGRTLLEQAASYIHENGGDTMEFECDGIYSHRVLPDLYNTVLDQRDSRAQATLDQVLSKELPVSRRRNSY